MSSHLDKTIALVLEQPLHSGSELRLLQIDEHHATTRFTVTPLISGPSGKLHGGVLYSLMDTTSYLALASTMGEGKGAVSHDAHFSVVRPVDGGETVQVKADVERQGRTVVFIRAKAHRVIEGQPEAEWPLVGLGTITKTLIG